MKIKLLTSVFALMLIGGVTSCSKTASPQSLADEFCYNYSHCNAEKLCMLYEGMDVDKSTMSDAEKQGYEKIKLLIMSAVEKKCGDIDSYTVDSVEISDDGTSATAKVTFKLKSGGTETEKLKMTKTDNGWRVKVM